MTGCCMQNHNTQKQPNKAIKHRYASLHWTAQALHFCGFASQNISTKAQHLGCRL
jgi:hypothetical protein